MDSVPLTVTFVGFSIALIALEGLLAYLGGMLTPGQMKSWGRLWGMPWLTHGGAFFGDAFLVTPVVARAIYLYAASWHFEDHIVQIIVVWIANGIFHWVWSRQKSPDCIACYGKLTPAGWPHFIYMGMALTFVVAFYFDTTIPIDPAFLRLASLIFGFHLFIGCHAIPSLWNMLARFPSIPIKRLDWWRVNTFMEPGALIPLVGCWIALYLRSRWMLLHQ